MAVVRDRSNGCGSWPTVWLWFVVEPTVSVRAETNVFITPMAFICLMSTVVNEEIWSKYEIGPMLGSTSVPLVRVTPSSRIRRNMSGRAKFLIVLNKRCCGVQQAIPDQCKLLFHTGAALHPYRIKRISNWPLRKVTCTETIQDNTMQYNRTVAAVRGAPLPLVELRCEAVDGGVTATTASAVLEQKTCLRRWNTKTHFSS